MALQDTKSSRPGRGKQRHDMMTPTAALRLLATRKRKLEVYIQEKKVDTRYGFNLGSLKLLLRPGERVEVIESVTACPIPNTPPWFAGMINLRGNLLPVFDIAEFLNIPDSESPGWIMVFGQGNQAAGIYVSELPAGVTPDSVTDVKPDLPDILQDCVINILMQGENMWLEIAFEKFFGNLRAAF